MSLAPQYQTFEQVQPSFVHDSADTHTASPTSSRTLLHPDMCLRLHVLSAMAGKPCRPLRFEPPPRPILRRGPTLFISRIPPPSRFLVSRAHLLGRSSPVLLSLAASGIQTMKRLSCSTHGQRLASERIELGGPPKSYKSVRLHSILLVSPSL
jgi:hypothetical protein